jgi:hypothetical protein
MASVYDIFIDQGSDSVTELVVRTDDGYIVDLTNFEIKSQFRKYHGSSTYHSFECEVVGPPTAGTVSLSLSGSVSSNIKSGRYLYDVEIFDSINNIRLRVLQGTVDISPEMTI